MPRLVLTLSLRVVLAVSTMIGVSGAADAKDRALIVGISDYKDTSISDLRGAPITDAKAFAGFIRDSMGVAAEDTMILTDAAATKRGILDQMDRWLVAGTKPGDRVFFYFSGHGFQQTDRDGDEADGLDETIVSSDARRVTTSAGVEVRDMISDDELHQRFAKLADRQVWVVVDACHSGTVLRGGAEGADESFSKFPLGLPLSPPALRRPSAGGSERVKASTYGLGDGENVDVWYAVAPDELAQVDQRDASPAMSLFTRALLNGMKNLSADANGDGVVSNAELLAHVRAESAVYHDACSKFAKAPCKTTITPMLQGGGKDLFVRPAFSSSSSRAALPVATPSAPVRTPPAEPQPAPARAPKPDAPPIARDAIDSRSFTAALPVQGANIALEIARNGRFRIGEAMTYRVALKEPGQLILLDLSPDGHVRQLYPNSYAPPARQRAGWSGVRVLPAAADGFVFRVNAPAGRGMILALSVEPNVDLDDVVSQLDFAALRAPTDHIAALAHKLNGLVQSGSAARPIRWASASAAYSVE